MRCLRVQTGMQGHWHGFAKKTEFASSVERSIPVNAYQKDIIRSPRKFFLEDSAIILEF
jgi:hypothetical protein